MEKLVKFLMVGIKDNIEVNESYLEIIMDKLNNDDFQIRFLTNTTSGHIEEYGECAYKSEFVFRRKYEISTNWMIDFQYGTFGEDKHLQVIISSDNYLLSCDNLLLEELKINLKNILQENWQETIWLIDKDSELLATDLYPLIYATENMTRQFINETMIKHHGIKWWDKFIPFKIKDKHHNRLSGYKSIVKNFKNVDEKLMSIDTGDLSTILFLKEAKWIPNYNEQIDGYINSKIMLTETGLKNILKKQTGDIYDLWQEIFSKYLPEDFQDQFKTFEKNRNHVMHNKLIDREATSLIRKSILDVESILIEALNKTDNLIMSVEQKSLAEELEYLRLKERKEFYTIYQEEAGVNIRSQTLIKDYFIELIEEFFNNFNDELRFRDYLTLETMNFVASDDLMEFFKITRNFDEKEIVLIGSYEKIDEEAGAESTLILKFSGDQDRSFFINYVNGNYYFNEEQGNYMPLTIEHNDLDQEELTDFLLEKIDSELINPLELADEESYVKIRNGGQAVILEIEGCEECGEESIYVGTDLAEHGTCLKCGFINTLFVCDRCHAIHANINFSDEEEYSSNLCDDCIEYHNKE